MSVRYYVHEIFDGEQEVNTLVEAWEVEVETETQTVYNTEVEIDVREIQRVELDISSGTWTADVDGRAVPLSGGTVEALS